MRMPVLFECPACGKKHYVAFCSGNDGGVECGRPFVSSFFPSGRDALCPTHQHAARPPAKGAAPPPPPDQARSRCPTTQEQIDIPSVLADPSGGASASPTTPRPPSGRGSEAPSAAPRRASPTTPRPPSRATPVRATPPPRARDQATPVAGVAARVDEADAPSAPSAAYLKCPSCFVIFDRARNETCPRCGASPDRAPKARPERNAQTLETLGESLTFLVLLRWRVLTVVAAVLVLGLGALAATTGAMWLTAICLLGVMVVLLAGIGATLVYFRAIETPYYRNQLAARGQGTAPAPSLLASVRAAWASTKRAAPSSTEPSEAPALGEERSTDLALASSLDSAPAAVLESGGAARSQASLTVAARYLGGDPALSGSRVGRLTFRGGDVGFESRRGALRLPAQAIQQIRLGWLGFVVALLLAGGIAAALVLLKPAPLVSYRVPDWIPWGPDFGVALRLAYRTALASAAVIGALAVLGLVFAKHVGVRVVCQVGDERRVVRFRTHVLGALRVARARD
ncbi:MAG: hypothetical protein U0610_31895 [bacterium]